MAKQGRYIEFLDGSGMDRDEAGGKAWALDRLAELGFNVPVGLVITASAYRRFVATGPIAGFLDAVRSRSPATAGSIGETEAQIEEWFSDQPMPREIEEDIRRCAVPLLAQGLVAVRSSATAEDTAEHSFAGQYRSYLGIADTDALFDAIRRCWASLWFPAACAYRSHIGVPTDGLAMAVIVQHQIPADWSGVVFTRDPHGDGSTMRIESVTGLGERLVSGRTTPADCIVDRSALEVISGDHTELPYLEDLARLAIRIERNMGGPQDIEWSVEAGRLWVLQSRPITVVRELDPDDDGFDSDVLVSDRYTPQGIDEMLPGVIPPLVWSINAPMVEEAFRAMFGRIGGTVRGVDRRFVGRFRGRAALNLSLMGEVAAAMPAGDVHEIEAAYLGPATAPEPSEASVGRASVRALIGNWRAQRRVEDEVRVLCTAVDCLHLIEPDSSVLSLEQLLAYRHELRDLAWRGTAAELTASAAATAAYRSLEVLLCRWLGDERGLREAQRATSGTLQETMVGPARLARLHAALVEAGQSDVDPSPVSGSQDRGHGGDVRRRLLDAGRTDVVAAIEDAGRQFGSMTWYAGPDFVESPDRLWQLAWSARELRSDPADPHLDLSSALDQLAADRRWKRLRLLTGQFIDLRRKLFLRMVADAVRFLRLREQAKRALLGLGGMERRVIVEGARRLVRSGHLAVVEDVDLLSDVEFEEMLRGGEPVARLEMRRRAAAAQLAHAGGPLPPSFGAGAGAGADVPLEPIRTDDVLHGWAASPGRVRAAIRRIDTLDHGGELRNGEILVATSTDPSWTPLFLRAGGIILEHGGPLSHAAIVARELGLPAVLNVPGAAQILHTGDLVELDGSIGTVRIAKASVMNGATS